MEEIISHIRNHLNSADAGANEEKRHRIYYQDIVYAVCNLLDKRDPSTIYPPGVVLVCGTVDSPTTQVQDAVEKLVKRSEASEARVESLRAECQAYAKELVAREASLEKELAEQNAKFLADHPMPNPVPPVEHVVPAKPSDDGVRVWKGNIYAWIYGRKEGDGECVYLDGSKRRRWHAELSDWIRDNWGVPELHGEEKAKFLRDYPLPTSSPPSTIARALKEQESREKIYGLKMLESLESGVDTIWIGQRPFTLVEIPQAVPTAMPSPAPEPTRW